MNEELDLFDRYIDKQLDDEAMIKFEQRLTAESGLKERFEDHRNVRTYAESTFLGELISDWRNEDETVVRKQQPNRFWIFLVIGLAVLTAIYLWTQRPIPKPADQASTHQMFAELYQPDPGLPTLMNDQGGSALMAGMVLYKIGDYEKAIEKWNDEPGTDTLSYFRGQSLLGLNRFQEASDQFFKILPDSPYYLESTYFDLLASLALNKDIIVREKFEILQRNNHRGSDLVKIKKFLK